MSDTKIFNDPVHGTIKLPSVLVKIIDTPEFQRLRYIKQLGGACYVYPGAQHTRFEHGIGTAHLAGKLMRHLKQQLDAEEMSLNTENKITEEDILCVQIAALCHDLGHGPFSHLSREKLTRKCVEKNQASWDILNKIFKKLRKKWGDEFPRILRDDDIKQAMLRTDSPHGYGSFKNCLFGIMSGVQSGTHVCMWDYIARDSFYLGMPNGFEYERYMNFLAIRKIGDGYHICIKDKEISNLYAMCSSMVALHKKAYQHAGVNAVEHMIADALRAQVQDLNDSQLEDFFRSCDDRVLAPTTSAIDSALTIIKAHVTKQKNDVKSSPSGDLESIIKSAVEISRQLESRSEISASLIERLHTGKRYKLVREKIIPEEQHAKTEHSFITEIVKEARKLDLPDEVNERDLRISICEFHFGTMVGRQKEFWSWSKNSDCDVRGKKESEINPQILMPKVFKEKIVQLFYVGEDIVVHQTFGDAFDTVFDKK